MASNTIVSMSLFREVEVNTIMRDPIGFRKSRCIGTHLLLLSLCYLSTKFITTHLTK